VRGGRQSERGQHSECETQFHGITSARVPASVECPARGGKERCAS
jgi:hypothetical protein